MNDSALTHFMQELVPITVSLGAIYLVGWIVSAVLSALKHRSQLRAQVDFHNRLLEKFGSAAEFTAYLQSDAGKRFFEGLTTERVAPTNRILSSIQKGTILTLLGIGLLVLGQIFGAHQGGDVFIFFGTISLMIGVGFLVSALISYRLSKSWGLIKANATKEPEAERASLTPQA